MDLNSAQHALSDFGQSAGKAWVWLGHEAYQFHTRPLFGACFALACLVYILIVFAVQNKNSPDFVRQYRHYEIALIIRKKLSVHRLVDYHRGIAWRDFAAISSGSGLAGAALLFGGGNMGIMAGAAPSGGGLSVEAAVIVVVSIGAQVASAVVMMICDFVHTNTISPLVPPLQRLKIVGEAIVLGGAAVIFNITALITFMSVFSPWVSVFCALVFTIAVVRLTSLRAIRVKELKKWLQINSDEEWAAVDEVVRLKGKKERDALFAANYDQEWSTDHENPWRDLK